MLSVKLKPILLTNNTITLKANFSLTKVKSGILYYPLPRPIYYTIGLIKKMRFCINNEFVEILKFLLQKMPNFLPKMTDFGPIFPENP